ncbi:VOC family protein [Burkholderia lata]|uniref:VOC family protein n=1 Tax=Burkholderia lata (strain ATCC 17760 / DSM 23089 / LMG 22485 / NCIMB 9086 / R18194 / 383) TaxID=482957 RepID=UPI00399BF16D
MASGRWWILSFGARAARACRRRVGCGESVASLYRGWAIHTGSGGKFPHPEFRPTGHGIALAIEVAHVSEAVARLESCRVSILNEWDYGDGTIAISVADPAGNVCEIWDRP